MSTTMSECVQYSVSCINVKPTVLASRSTIICSVGLGKYYMVFSFPGMEINCVSELKLIFKGD